MKKILGAVALSALLIGGLAGASLHLPGAHAGGFEAVHSPAGTAPVVASTGYADLVARVAPSIVTVRSERMVKPAALPFGDDDENGPLPFFGRRFPGPGEPRREGGLGSG